MIPFSLTPQKHLTASKWKKNILFLSLNLTIKFAVNARSLHGRIGMNMSLKMKNTLIIAEIMKKSQKNFSNIDREILRMCGVKSFVCFCTGSDYECSVDIAANWFISYWAGSSSLKTNNGGRYLKNPSFRISCGYPANICSGKSDIVR